MRGQSSYKLEQSSSLLELAILLLEQTRVEYSMLGHSIGELHSIVEHSIVDMTMVEPMGMLAS